MLDVFSRTLERIGEYIRMVVEVFWVILKRPPAWKLLRNQLFDIGVMSLPVVAFTGAFTGMVLAAQSFFQLSDKGLASATGLMVGKAMMTELGPVLTAFMVTGRVGASMCAELGTMGVTEQIDALKSMAVNPLRYLVAPRFIAGILMLPLLTMFSCLTGIIGGFLVAVYYFGLSANSYFDPMPLHITNFDFFLGVIKAFVFGVLIVTISCFKGMTTRGGAAGVGKSTTNSVVICYSMILISNFILTLIMNTIYGYLEEIVGHWL
jgi:phospholipid/cholesterol/gamma-HCH transport system permease protein